MKRLILLVLLIVIPTSLSWADTDFISSLKSSGGDYTDFETLWEPRTDDIDFAQTNKVVSGIVVTSGSFPASTTVVDDGAGNSGTIRATMNANDEGMICNVTGTLVADGLTEYCDSLDVNCFTFTGQDDLGSVWIEVFGPNLNIRGTFSGASNTSAAHHRGIIGNNFTATGSPHINYTGASTTVLYIGEPYFVVRNLNLTMTVSNAVSCNVIQPYADNVLVDGCAIHDPTNSGAGSVNGINTISVDGFLAYRTIVDGADGDGFDINAGVGEASAAICCTAKGNGGQGFEGSATGTVFVWSCYAEDNTGGDFATSNWDSVSGYNASKDATALGIGVAGAQFDLNLDADGLAQDSTNMSGANHGRNPYDDISVTAGYTFSNFLWNGATGDSNSELDILGDSRPTPHTVDVQWHVGADQYIGSGVLPQVIINSW